MEGTTAPMEEASSTATSVMNWVLDNKLKAIFYTWGSGVTGSLMYQWTRPIPTSLKIIHSRVYAQAITLGALGAVAALETYSQSQRGQAGKKDEEDY